MARPPFRPPLARPALADVTVPTRRASPPPVRTRALARRVPLLIDTVVGHAASPGPDAVGRRHRRVACEVRLALGARPCPGPADIAPLTRPTPTTRERPDEARVTGLLTRPRHRQAAITPPIPTIAAAPTIATKPASATRPTRPRAPAAALRGPARVIPEGVIKDLRRWRQGPLGPSTVPSEVATPVQTLVGAPPGALRPAPIKGAEEVTRVDEVVGAAFTLPDGPDMAGASIRVAPLSHVPRAPDVGAQKARGRLVLTRPIIARPTVARPQRSLTLMAGPEATPSAMPPRPGPPPGVTPACPARDPHTRKGPLPPPLAPDISGTEINGLPIPRPPPRERLRVIAHHVALARGRRPRFEGPPTPTASAPRPQTPLMVGEVQVPKR